MSRLGMSDADSADVLCQRIVLFVTESCSCGSFCHSGLLDPTSIRAIPPLFSRIGRHPIPLETPTAHTADHQPPLRWRPNRPQHLHARSHLPQRRRPRCADPQPQHSPEIKQDPVAKSSGSPVHQQPCPVPVRHSRFLTPGPGAGLKDDSLAQDSRSDAPDGRSDAWLSESDSRSPRSRPDALVRRTCRPSGIGRAARQQIPRASDSMSRSPTLRLRQSDAPQVAGIRFIEPGHGDCRTGMAVSQGRVNGMRMGRLPEDSNMRR